MKSKIGWGAALVYIALSAYLIATQGLFGESFIAIILGLPWTLIFSYFEFGGAGGPLLYAMLLGPIVLNALVLYFLGSLFDRRKNPPVQ